MAAMVCKRQGRDGSRSAGANTTRGASAATYEQVDAPEPEPAAKGRLLVPAEAALASGRGHAVARTVRVLAVDDRRLAGGGRVERGRRLRGRGRRRLLVLVVAEHA